MKKMKFNNSLLSDSQILTRNQLKQILGGSAGPGSGDPGACTTTCSVWDPTIKGMVSKDCVYYPGSGSLPGWCGCPSGTNKCS